MVWGYLDCLLTREVLGINDGKVVRGGFDLAVSSKGEIVMPGHVFGCFF